MIYYNYEDVSDIELDTDLLNNWINNIIKKYKGISGEISFIFCSDRYLLEINKKYLEHDYYTDIITFDYCENNKISGDIFISLDTVLSNSKEFNTEFNDELNRVIIHGILHLIGFKDKTEEENAEMHRMEDLALEDLKTIS